MTYFIHTSRRKMAASAPIKSHPHTMRTWLVHVLKGVQEDIKGKTSFQISHDAFLSGNHKVIVIPTNDTYDIILGRKTKRGPYVIVQAPSTTHGRDVAQAILAKLNGKRRRFTNTTNSNSNSNSSGSSNEILIGKTRRSRGGNHTRRR